MVTSNIDSTPAPATPEPIPDSPGAIEPGLLPSLAALVHHRQSVDVRTPLAEMQRVFQECRHDHIAIVDEGKVVGLCSKSTVGIMLGSRYGFALYGTSAVWTARSPRPLIYTPATPISDVLHEVFLRTGSEFFEDVVLVDSDRSLLGLVSVPELARLKVQFCTDQMRRIVDQDEELRQQNLELFQVNQQLRQAQGRTKALFENNALGAALLDKDGTVVAHNHRFATLLQLGDDTRSEGMNLADCVAAADRPRLARLLSDHESLAPLAEPRLTELRLEPAGAARLFEVHTNWVAETGQICAFFADITDQRALEQQAARQDKQNLLDTLVAGVAHELNNKLTPVLGFADLLHVSAPPALQTHTACIRQGTMEAARIIRQLLSLSRPEGPAQDQVDLGQVCQDALQMLSFQIREAHCTVDLQVPEVRVGVRGDAAQLKQVLINLFLNSLHAMEDNPAPRLRVAIRREGSRACLLVSDNGRGIKPEHLGRIFDPFFTTKGPKGTGLGLSISASIIRQHGGDIGVESPAGEGATFTICLPISEPPALVLSSSPGVRPGTRPWSADGPRSRVLVVDDEEFVRQFLQEALRLGFGCSVDTAADGVDAVALLSAHEYHLVVSDIRMPRMDGWQLRTWLQQHQPSLAERFVFVTGHAGTVELDEAVGKLTCPVIRKPFTVATIKTACDSFL